MARYLVEAYVPRVRAQEAGAEERRVLDAAAELAGEGVRIDFVRTTCIPDDDTCFHVVDADSIEAVRELCSRAGLDAARVVVAVEPDPRPVGGGQTQSLLGTPGAPDP